MQGQEFLQGQGRLRHRRIQNACAVSLNPVHQSQGPEPISFGLSQFPEYLGHEFSHAC
jgi:hypothetical protein